MPAARLAAYAAALLAAAGCLPVAGAGAGSAADAESLADAVSGARSVATSATPGPVVLVGAPDLRWSDLSAQATPTLWQLAGAGAPAALSARTVVERSCPADGWLSVSAGARAALDPTDDTATAATCPPLPPVQPTAAGRARIAGLPAIRAANTASPYAATVGLLGDAFAAAGSCVAAAGPGAALAAARSDDAVAAYRPDPSQAGELTGSCPVTVVDTGGGPPAVIDAIVADLQDTLPPEATLLVAGLADTGPTPHLHVVVATGPAPGGAAYAGRWLTSAATRRDGLVQVVDLTPTLLALAGVDPPAGLTGTPLRPGGDRPDDAAAVVGHLAGRDTAAHAVRRIVPPFFLVLSVGQVLAYLALYAAIRRRGVRTSGLGLLRLLGLLRGSAVAIAAVPIATYLADVVPWWRADHPLPTLLGAVALSVAAITALAYAGPWRSSLLGPPVVVSAVTAVVLAADVVTGARLQLDSLLGYSPLDAGRFNGLGNVGFAFLSTGMLLAATGLADTLTRRGHSRRTAAVAVGALGLAAVVVVGWPGWGNDAGGALALLPGVALLTLMVAGVRARSRKAAAAAVGAVAALSVALVVSLAALDLLRPPERRTHLGRFAAQLIEGDAGAVLTRRAAASLDALTAGPLTLIVPPVLLWLALAVARPARFGGSAWAHAYVMAPLLRAGLASVLLSWVIAALVNDSGVVIPAVALLLAVPWMMACLAGAYREYRGVIAADDVADDGAAAPTARGRTAALGGSGQTSPPR